MQNLLKLSARLFFCLLLPLSCLYATTGGPIQVGYLVDYHFAHLDGNWATAGTQGKISDWDVDSRAGSIDCVYWNYLTITDSSTTRPIEMWKPFLPQSSGTISVEFKFALPTKVDGMVWALRADRDNSLIKFLTSGGNFGYENSSGTFVALVTNYTAGQTYTVHVDVALPEVSATVTINGYAKSTPNIFRWPNLTQASQFYVSTPTATTGVMNLYYVTITKGYKLYERFTNAAASAVPVNWTANAAGGIASVQAAYGSNPKDILSFKLEDASTTLSATLGRNFAASTGKLVWEFKFMLPAKVDGVSAQLRGGSASAMTFVTANGSLACQTPLGTLELWPNYKANLWYTIRVVANPATQKADIFVNGKPRGQVDFTSSVTTFDEVLFSTSATGTSPLWVDDIYVYDFQAEPVDYVPAVQPVAGRGYQVGMQTFFAGWRDGQHNGWDWIYRFPNHDPYIGFYDNGNVEAMDWQLKCLAESGVNYFMECWYVNNGMRNPGGVLQPMKEPQFEYTEGPIHSAYFYAKYADKVKFAIADYSLTSTTEADFCNVIMPYWMEYYFKDSRYFVVPGANRGYPVLGLGNATSWMWAANNAMKNSLAALRSELQAEGFDGLIVIAWYTGSSKAVMDDLHNAGVDYCYAYHWGTNTISTVQGYLTAQRDAGSLLKPIADATQGWSGEAWDLNSRGYVSLTDFESMNNWLKGTFMPSTTLSGLLSSSMVLYDNWNEFGEGHYICPTNLAGFGYTDRIRSAFTSTTLTNATPTAAQKARMNILYTRAWEGRVWAFDSLYADTEGWSANYNVSTLTQNKGVLEGTTSGVDPSILSRDGYAIDASLYKKIKVRMNNPTAATMAKFYFITNTDGSYSESKSKNFAITPNTSNYTEYTINMSTVPAWNGTIRRLRFDPFDTGAVSGTTFNIDWIKVTQ